MLHLLKMAPFINSNPFGLGTKGAFDTVWFVYEMTMFCVFLDMKFKGEKSRKMRDKELPEKSSEIRTIF